MIVKEIITKTCLSKSKLTDYVINPYLGCQHACAYCYAVFMKRFHDVAEPWGEFVHVKINSPEVLEHELGKAKAGNIWMSSVTDAYHPLEGKYRLTRRILEVLECSERRNEFPVEILTKSALVRRDFDLLTRLDATLGCSVNTLDAKAARVIEPFASAPMKRIEALKKAKDLGLAVYGFISPVIPGITNLDGIFRELSFCDYVWVELLNTKSSVLTRLLPVLRRDYAASEGYIEKCIRKPEAYYKNVTEKVSALSRQYDLRVRAVVRHDKS